MDPAFAAYGYGLMAGLGGSSTSVSGSEPASSLTNTDSGIGSESTSSHLFESHQQHPQNLQQQQDMGQQQPHQQQSSNQNLSSIHHHLSTSSIHHNHGGVDQSDNSNGNINNSNGGTTTSHDIPQGNTQIHVVIKFITIQKKNYSKGQKLFFLL